LKCLFDVVEGDEEDEVDHEDSLSANIVKRKYSLRSLSQKKSARSKPLRNDKGSSKSLGEADRSPMASSDKDEFRRGLESTVDEAIDSSDSVDGILDHDEAIFGRYCMRGLVHSKKVMIIVSGFGLSTVLP
jgi:hypothetical protein